MDISKYYDNLITQDPINYNGLIIYQPSYDEIKNYGIDIYNQIMMIYSLTLDCFNNLPDKVDINIFNELILNDEYLLRCLSESLRLLTKADEIILFKDTNNIQLKFFNVRKEVVKEEIINKNTFKKKFIKWLYKIFKKELKKKFIEKEIETKDEKLFNINSSNFDDISEIILKINANQKIKVEKPPANMSSRQKDIWEKLQEGRRRDAKKNEIHIYDILNICQFCGSYIPIEEIKKWSLWRIMNCYKSKIGIKTYDDNLQIALVSGDGKSVSGSNHWHYQLMIRE